MKQYLLLLSFFQSVFGYKPVLLIHGVLSSADHLEDMENLIKLAHPGTEVYMIKLYPEVESFVPLTHQLTYWMEKIKPIMESSPEGVHLICHSQGGLICQGIVEFSDNHNINTFVALSSPMNGQFGVTSFIAKYVPWLNGTRESLTKYMYTRFVQDTFAISNYWRDPRINYQSEYLSMAHYLPVLQSNPKSTQVNISDIPRIMKNFLKLKKLVLIGGPDDGVITPWQSSLFGYYDANYQIINMTNSPVFQQDWFGLRQLYQTGRLFSYVFPGVKHIFWHGDKAVFEKAIEPYLD